jgi:site-specific DNA-methyltransferase (adenine-specific)
MPVKKAPSTQIEMPVFASQGVQHEIASPNCVSQLHYEGKKGHLFVGDSIVWLRTLESASVDLVFADPPYNIKKAEWDDFESMHSYVAWSHE